jgi:agmatinase
MYGIPAEDLSALDADVAFLGVPYDLGHASKPGARLGPASIREASSASVAGPLGPKDAGFHDRETGRELLSGIRVVDVGDVDVPVANVEQSLANVTTAVSAIVARKAMPVVVGGDHSITFAVLRGFKDAGRRIHVVHFDAHQDFGDIGPAGDVFGHGNHLRHAAELPWVSGMTMVGLRGLARGNGGTANEVRRRGYEMISSSDIVQHGVEAAVARIPMAESYYVTLDIDVLDPAIAPATGTPVPGGLSYYQLCDILDRIAARGRLAGFDVMEVSPPYDLNDATASLAAYVALRFLGSAFSHQRPLSRA